jgi:hypothetical protein
MPNDSSLAAAVGGGRLPFGAGGAAFRRLIHDAFHGIE